MLESHYNTVRYYPELQTGKRVYQSFELTKDSSDKMLTDENMECLSWVFSDNM